ncbi:MAG: OmpA family protein [Muribaculaceae bacterium]|jgi:outer membrane protein OmpA-like peptidoglycan-associated protein|nr:OmpA family protein [Muribaculaceae bacterium]
MKKNVLLTAAMSCAMLVPALQAKAQGETVVVEEETVAVSEVPCKTHYYVPKTDNWFIQFGAGVATPFVEGVNDKGDRERHFTVNYNLGFGKWFSPYMGFRVAFNGGPLHWEDHGMYRAKYVGANVDFMWDMFNSLGGANSKRVFSIVPFVGLGATYLWDQNPAGNISMEHGYKKTKSVTLPVSAGLQLRFRLCKYVDFFAEARAGFYGDNFNNIAFGRPIDINLTVNGGFAVTFGGRDYQAYNPCDYLGYIDNLNNQVNDLRGSLATTAAALAAAEAQLPCPEVVEQEVVVETAPLMATVRFSLNSSKITDTEMVNVFNIAEWMKANPEQNVAIVGYADKDTGTSEYNMGLSKRRAQSVYDALTGKYGISGDRLTIQAEGSDVQPYSENNWNRIVIFSAQ